MMKRTRCKLLRRSGYFISRYGAIALAFAAAAMATSRPVTDALMDLMSATVTQLSVF